MRTSPVGGAPGMQTALQRRCGALALAVLLAVQGLCVALDAPELPLEMPPREGADDKPAEKRRAGEEPDPTRRKISWLAARLPRRVLAYARIPSPASLREQYGGSSLAAILTNGSTRAFLEAAWADRADLLQRGLRTSPAAAEGLAELLGRLGPCDAEVALLPQPDRPHAWCVALLAPDPVSPAEVREMFPEAEMDGAWLLLAPEKGALRLRTWEGKVVAKTSAAALLGTAADESLHASSSYARAREKVGDRGTAPFAYVDLAMWQRQLDTGPLMDEAISLLGLGGARSLSVGGARRVDDLFEERLWLESPGWRDGLLGALQRGARLPPGPPGAEYRIGIRADFTAVWRTVKTILARHAPAVAGHVENAEATVGKALGAEVAGALNTLFAAEAALLPSRPEAPPRLWPPDTVIRMPVRDPQRLAKAFTAIRMLTGTWKWRTVGGEEGEVHAYDLAGPMTPAYQLTDEALYLGAYPQAVWRRSLLYPALNPEDGAMGGEAAVVAVVSASDECEALYEAGLVYGHGLAARGVQLRPELLPPYEDLGVRWGQTTVTVVPGQTGLGCVITGPAGALSPAIWAGGHALRERAGVDALLAEYGGLVRERARQAAEAQREAAAISRKRLGEILAAVGAYRADHGGHPPEAAGALVRGGYIGAGALAVPDALGGGEYALFPMAGDLLPATPVAREPTGRRVRVIFGDGTIDNLSGEEIRALETPSEK